LQWFHRKGGNRACGSNTNLSNRGVEKKHRGYPQVTASKRSYYHLIDQAVRILGCIRVYGRVEYSRLFLRSSS